MRSTNNWILATFLILFLLPLVSPVSGQEDLTIASVLPLTGQFGAGRIDGRRRAKGLRGNNK